MKPPESIAAFEEMSDEELSDHAAFLEILETMERLKEKGLIEGGPSINRPMSQVVIELAKSRGCYRKFTDNELRDVIRFIQNGGLDAA